MNTHLNTVGDLAERYFGWLDREIRAGRRRPATASYYRRQLGRWLDLVGADRQLADLIPWDLEQHKTGWHSVTAVKRLFNWAVGVGLVSDHPFRRVEAPPHGQRERILSRAETALLLRTAGPAFRRFLVGLRHTMARPQELAALQWRHLQPDGRSFVLTQFKAKDRRRDGVKIRIIALDSRMRRFVGRRRHRAQLDDYVFTNSQGKRWTGNALRCAMRRVREKAGLLDGGELVVCYTFRHTAATEATANGVRDRRLADLLGHATTRTTARYQHLALEHLAEAIDQATARRRPAGPERRRPASA